MRLKAIAWLLINLIATFGIQAADQELVTIELSHRLAEEMVPLIQPLLDPDEAVIPNHSLLIVRANPAKIAEIQTLLGQLDRRQHRLMVTVAQGSGLSLAVLNARAGLQAQIDPRRPGGVQLSGRGHIYQTESRNVSDQTQRVQTLDGQPAIIRFGQEIPLPSQGIVGYGYHGPIIMVNPGIEYRQASTGFAVTPRVSGTDVIIEAAPWSDRISREGGGFIDTQGARTTIKATLGEWVEIGGQVETHSQSQGGILTHGYSTRTEANKIFIRVDDLDAGQP